MKRLGVGIIGLGVGKSQAPGFVNDERVNKVVLCDIDENKLQSVAEDLGIEDTTTDWKELVNRKDLHIISVASPDHLHGKMAIAALKAGKHVLCEKPMAMNVKECRSIIKAVETSGKKLLVNCILRFFERFSYVKRIVDSGELGKIYAAEGDYLHNTLDLIINGWRGPHRHSVMTGGGVHLIDLLRWIVGEIEQVSCFGTYGALKPKQSKSPDCMMAVLKFSGGAVGKAMTNMAAARPALHNFILYGTKGVFINGKPHGQIYKGHNSEPELVTAVYGPPPSAQGQKSVAVNHLLNCIENDTSPLIDVYEGARDIAVCDAIFKSYKSGRPEDVCKI